MRVKAILCATKPLRLNKLPNWVIYRNFLNKFNFSFRYPIPFRYPVPNYSTFGGITYSRVGNRPGRVGQSLLADPIPIFSGSGHLMPDPVPTLVGIISGSTRSRTHLGEVLADPDRDLDRVAEFNPRYLT